MRVVLSTITKFHTFDLARQLLRHDVLKRIYSGYPWWKLKGEHVDRDLVDTFPWIVVPRMALARYGMLRGGFHAAIDELSQTRFAAHVARTLPECDIFHGLSRYSLAPGLEARRRGNRFILDVGSAHILTQRKLLTTEADTLGIRIDMPHPRAVERELAEYEAADLITLPSGFTVDSFIEEGVPARKLAKVPYGVDLSRFAPREVVDDGRFRVIFIGALSMGKGIQYLIEAFRRAAIPDSELVLIGSHAPETPRLLAGSDDLDIVVTGHVPQPELAGWLSRSTIFVLPSIQEGLALVQLQAMACGCPVIGTTNSGSLDIVREGENGFVVPIRNPDAIAEKLVWLHKHPDAARAMRQAAIAQASSASNVSRYGDDMVGVYRALLDGTAPPDTGP
jgi:glycosyltransferase involved in cell wall biosynthesis